MRKSLTYATQLLSSAALAFALAGVLAPAAQAQRFERHFEPHPVFGPHVWFDERFHHDHFYPALGFTIATLPVGYRVVHWRDGDYYFHAGVWYRRAGANYVVVEPPVGVVVPVLPPAYTTVWVGSVPYYYANGAYYAAAPGGYAVVAPPANAVAAPPPQAAAAAPQAGTWSYCESAKNYYPYVQQCPEGWRTVPATPPHPGS